MSDPAQGMDPEPNVSGPAQGTKPERWGFIRRHSPVITVIAVLISLLSLLTTFVALYFGVFHGGAPATEVTVKVIDIAPGPRLLAIEFLVDNNSRHQLSVNFAQLLLLDLPSRRSHQLSFTLYPDQGPHRPELFANQTVLTLAAGDGTELWAGVAYNRATFSRVRRSVFAVIAVTTRDGRFWWSRFVAVGNLRSWPRQWLPTETVTVTTTTTPTTTTTTTGSP